MVFDSSITFEKTWLACGPMSSPIQPSLIALLLDISVFALASNLSAMMESIGKCRSTPFAFAFRISSLASSSLSSSTNDLPMFPPSALKNVYAMPPPIMRLSTTSSIFSMISILSEIFAPPIMAVKGFSAFSNTFLALSSSAAMTRPAHLSLKNCATIVVDACARCAVPKASFTYT